MTTMARLRAIPSWQITLGVALLALGFLIAAQLASEGPRVRYTTQERTPLLQTADELQAEQDALKARILDLRAQIQAVEGQGAGAEDRVRQLNDRLEQARIAAGLIALTGSGLVLQLEDSRAPVPPDGRESDYLVGSRDIRAVVEELWGAGAEAIAVNGERITPTSAIIDVGTSLLVNSAYLAAAVPGDGARTGRPVRPTQRVDRVRGLRARAQRGLRHPRLAGGARRGRRAGFRRDRHPALFAPDRIALGGPVPGAEPGRGGLTMHRPRSQLTIAAVAFVLGVLVVVQLRSQAGDPGLAQLSSQDLTVLVANLNARNDQLRREGSTLERELATLVQNRSRGDVSVDEITADLERVRAYAGLDPVAGPGVMISISGPIDGPGWRSWSTSCATPGRRRSPRAGSGS